MRPTIGKKLNSLVVLLSLLSIFGVVTLATHLYTEDLAGTLRKNTLDSAVLLAGRVRAEVRQVADQARILGAASLQSFQHAEDQVKFLEDNVAIDSQLLGMSLHRFRSGENLVVLPRFEPDWRVLHPELAKKLQLTALSIAALDSVYPLDLTAVSQGTVDFAVATLSDGTASLRMAIPLVQREDGTFSQVVVMDLLQEKLSGLFADSTSTLSYLIDRKGRILTSTDLARMPPGDDMSSVLIVRNLRAAKGVSGQLDFRDQAGKMQIGAFQKVGFGELAIVSQIPLARAESSQELLYRRASLLGLAFLFLALCVGFIFSQGITRPIQALASAAESVARGDFLIRLPTRKKKGLGDEIEEFSKTFNQMVIGLQERDRVKATFAKFHSKDVAEKLMSGEVKLGGERMEAVVFFSDVRGFTAMSEKLAPEALVQVLNRYMTRMVQAIFENGGIVDKYVGDAIMAVWGAPISKPEDCENALIACLRMRQALSELNKEFASEGLPVLRIGMGVNYGPLVAGNIGSDERMEYTVIGDTVNTASRIESLTKEFGTDLLVSEELKKRLENKFIFEKAHEVRVKGKVEPLLVYKVHGFIDESGKEFRVETPYSSYEAEKSDKVVH